MGSIFHFIIGFLLEFLKMLVGSAVICAIVGFFYVPALYVLVPLFLLVAVIEAFKGGMARSSGYQVAKKHRKHLRRMKKAFNEDELFEFDSAWRQMSGR